VRSNCRCSCNRNLVIAGRSSTRPGRRRRRRTRTRCGSRRNRRRRRGRRSGSRSVSAATGDENHKAHGSGCSGQPGAALARGCHQDDEKTKPYHQHSDNWPNVIRRCQRRCSSPGGGGHSESDIHRHVVYRRDGRRRERATGAGRQATAVEAYRQAEFARRTQREGVNGALSGGHSCTLRRAERKEEVTRRVANCQRAAG